MPLPTNKLQFRLMTLTDKAAVIDCLLEAFTQREPLGVAFSVTPNEVVEYATLLADKAIREAMGMVVVDTTANNTIIGCILCEDFRGEPLNIKSMLESNPKIAASSALLSELQQPLDGWTKNLGIICRAIIMSVNKEYTKHGVALILMLEMLKYLHQKGYRYVFGEYTNPFSYKMMHKLDGGSGKDLKVIELNDFHFRGEQLFKGSTQKVILRVNDLSQVLANASKLKDTGDNHLFFKRQLHPFTYEILSDDNLAKTIEILAKIYCDETMAKALKVTLFEAKKYIELLCRRSLPTGMTLVIKDTLTGEVIGAIISEDLSKPLLQAEDITHLGEKFLIDQAFLEFLRAPITHTL